MSLEELSRISKLSRANGLMIGFIEGLIVSGELNDDHRAAAQSILKEVKEAIGEPFSQESM